MSPIKEIPSQDRPSTPEAETGELFDVGFNSIAKNDPNQDATMLLQSAGVFAVFDGAGGIADGNIASKMGAQKLRQIYESDPNADLINSLQLASDEISRATAEGVTTAAVVRVVEKSPDSKSCKIQLTSIGDARVYILSKEGKIRALTVDNISKDSSEQERQEALENQMLFSRVKELKELSPVEQALFRQRNVISQYLGQRQSETPIIYRTTLQEGETVILTSDGVHDNLTDQEIAEIGSSQQNSQQISEKLTEAARVRSTEQVLRRKADDTTAVVLKFRETAGVSLAQELKDMIVEVPKTEVAATIPEGRMEKGRPLLLDIDALESPFTLRLADFALELSKLEQPGQPAKLKLSVPAKAGSEESSTSYFTIDQGALNNPVVIGRNGSLASKLNIELPLSVSRNHLEIGFDGKTISLKDISANGTEIILPKPAESA